MADGQLVAMADDEQVEFTVEFRNRKNKVVPVDGVPVWSTSDPAIVAVEPAADGLTCVCKGQDAGNARVSVTADPNLNAEVETLTAFADFSVAPSQAMSALITHGAITKQELGGEPAEPSEPA